jgi:hypothetical protein
VPRRLKIKTQEMGDLELYLIYQYGVAWEEDWLPLQGNPISTLLSVATKEDLDHALRGWSWPMTSKLGISPAGGLRKVLGKQCYRRSTCPFYEKKSCVPTAKALPTCFEPDDIEEDVSRKMAAEVIRMWREGVYVVVVLEEGVE